MTCLLFVLFQFKDLNYKKMWGESWIFWSWLSTSSRDSIWFVDMFSQNLPSEQPSSPIASGLQAFHPCLVRGWDSSSTTDVHATTDEQLEKFNSLVTWLFFCKYIPGKFNGWFTGSPQNHPNGKEKNTWTEPPWLWLQNVNFLGWNFTCRLIVGV